MSPGERSLLRFRWFVYDAGARPVAVAAALVTLGAIASMAASLIEASADSLGGFRQWVFFASTGFGTDVQLGVLVAALLLVIDALAGDAFPGQRAIFGLILIVAAAGLVGNVTALAAWLTEVYGGPIGAGTNFEAWTVIVATYLAPTVLAAVSVWMALTGARWSGKAKEHLHEL